MKGEINMSTTVIRNEFYRDYTLHTEDNKMDLENTITKRKYENAFSKNKEESKISKLISTLKSRRVTKAEKIAHTMRLNEVERSQEKAREFYHYNTFNR